jgi:hypothetical protein
MPTSIQTTTLGTTSDQTRRRATLVPQEGVNNGQSGSLLTTASGRPRPVPGHHWRVPKLSIKHTCLRRASAPGWSQDRARGVVGHQGAGIPSHRRRRHSRPGVGGPARSARWVLQLDPLPQACSETSSPTRRDTRFRPGRPAASQYTRVPLACHYHGPTTVNGGAL